VTCIISTGFFSVSSCTYIGIVLFTSLGFLVALFLSFFFCTWVSSFLSIGFPMPLPFFFCTRISGRDCSLTTSLGIDDLVKGLLPLVLTVEGEEGKCSFFPFLDVVLVKEGTSSNPGGGGGEKSYRGEGKDSSSAPVTCLLTYET